MLVPAHSPCMLWCTAADAARRQARKGTANGYKQINLRPVLHGCLGLCLEVARGTIAHIYGGQRGFGQDAAQALHALPPDHQQPP